MPRLSMLTGFLVVILLAVLSGCTSQTSSQITTGQAPTTVSVVPTANRPLKVVAAETFLADIAQNVAGSRIKVGALMPVGVDIHGFEPTPGDIAKVADSDVFIISGTGLEEFLGKILSNNSKQPVIEASAGLKSRIPAAGEPVDEDNPKDPHFWLDPNEAITYTLNIRDGLSKADPAGAATYAANADSYIKQLKDLDIWIAEQVKQVPQENRLLVTNHESFGYFGDRYGFKVVGAIIPSVSTEAQPSARDIVNLVKQIKTTGAKAIFLETGSNAQLADQVAKETGIKTVTQLYTHSVSEATGPAPTYIEMIKYNAKAIVEGLK